VSSRQYVSADLNHQMTMDRGASESIRLVTCSLDDRSAGQVARCDSHAMAYNRFAGATHLC
jgi:hypothetical protein